MAKKTATGRVPKMGSKQDTTPHPANPKSGKTSTAATAVHKVDALKKSGALGQGQDGDPGSATANVGPGVPNGANSRGGKYNHDGPGAQGDVHTGTFPALDTGQAQQGGRAGGFGG